MFNPFQTSGSVLVFLICPGQATATAVLGHRHVQWQPGIEDQLLKAAAPGPQRTTHVPGPRRSARSAADPLPLIGLERGNGQQARAITRCVSKTIKSGILSHMELLI